MANIYVLNTRTLSASTVIILILLSLLLLFLFPFVFICVFEVCVAIPVYLQAVCAGGYLCETHK